MAGTIIGRRSWGGSRDSEGYRTYNLKTLITADPLDGPATILNTPGLPLPGSIWAYGNDLDPYVWCRPDATVAIHQEREGDPNRWWTIDQVFSNKPLDLKRCYDQANDNPLLEPPKLSGSFVKYVEEATHDRFGKLICTSSFEQVRGQQVEFDRNRPSVVWEFNVPIFDLPLFASMVDTVNDAPLWGLLPRMIKLSSLTWSRLYYGQCYIYYTLRLEFDVNYNTFDRFIVDEGNKVLEGRWNRANNHYILDEKHTAGFPDPLNPSHFVVYKDPRGENTRVMLNGRGLPGGTTVDYLRFGQPLDSPSLISEETDIASIYVQKYEESNFLLTGVPPLF